MQVVIKNLNLYNNNIIIKQAERIYNGVCIWIDPVHHFIGIWEPECNVDSINIMKISSKLHL